jgi:16S rRNA (guanine966-N2)-methyltransferase
MRIIAGLHRGRRLVTPRGRATRPTSDRTRETLFALLGDLQGIRFLDLFAGSGAVGIEALSRGATRVCFVESARAALAALRANLQTIDATATTTVVACPLPGAVERLAVPFDVAFLDPPYAEATLLRETLVRLIAATVVAPQGVVVMEHDARDTPILPAGLVAASTRRVGDTAFTFAHLRDAT